jgi:hypothetical protein
MGMEEEYGIKSESSRVEKSPEEILKIEFNVVSGKRFRIERSKWKGVEMIEETTF